jgi:hypothetical protein
MPTDEARFYEREPVEEITRHAWTRILDPVAPVYAIVAEDALAGVVGIANYLIQDSTSALAPGCYSQDLYVDPAIHARGMGRRSRSSSRSRHPHPAQRFPALRTARSGRLALRPRSSGSRSADPSAPEDIQDCHACLSHRTDSTVSHVSN